MMGRIQKFLSHMLLEAQREMHKNIDNHQQKFKKQIDEYDTMLQNNQHWEFVYNKFELKSLRRQMYQAMEKYKEPKENIHKFSKIEILKNLSAYLKDLMEVIDFTIQELTQTGMQATNPKASDINESQAAQDFDFLLDSPSVKNLKKILSQKRYLHERDELLPKIKEAIDEIKFRFRNIPNSQGVMNDYTAKIDINTNSDIKNEFIRIEKGDHVYYG